MKHTHDVLVAGGGPAGIGAAIAAARVGVKTALIERHDVLGGMGTAGLVNNFCPAHLDGYRLIIGGVFAEIRRELMARRAIHASPDGRYMMEPYDPEVFAAVARELCEQAGVDLLLDKQVTRVQAGGTACLSFADGSAARGRTVVDTTGDAMVAAAAGVPFTFGREKDHAVMPLTYCYEIGPIDLDALEAGLDAVVRVDEATGEKCCCISTHPVVDRWVAEARASGELTIPRDHVASIMSIPGRADHATVNFGRVGCKDPTDPVQLAQAEQEGRRQIEEGLRFFRKYLPGFAQIRLIQAARQIGVRETRQVVGLYTLTGEDAAGCRQFEDAIAQCCYAIDIHDPDSEKTMLREFRRGTHYDIPWRCLIPAQGPSNLVVGGRCISATQEAMSSFRVSPSVMAIGEAAGVTAALAAMNGGDVRKVSPDDVRKRLSETGAILE